MSVKGQYATTLRFFACASYETNMTYLGVIGCTGKDVLNLSFSPKPNAQVIIVFDNFGAVFEK